MSFLVLFPLTRRRLGYWRDVLRLEEGFCIFFCGKFVFWFRFWFDLILTRFVRSFDQSFLFGFDKLIG